VQTSLATQIRADGLAWRPTAAVTEWEDDGTLTPAPKENRPQEGKKKSPVKAAALSALVPGLGQLYNDRDIKARCFFAAEGLTWVAFGAFRLYGDWKKDDLIAYAAVHANAQLEGKSDQYLDWVGFYDSIDDFNRAGRVGDPDRRYLPDVPEYHWVWPSDAERETFRSLKNSSREAYRRGDWMLWAAVINRVVAVIDAVLDARRANRVVDEGWTIGGVRYDLEFHPTSPTRQVALTVYPGF